MINIINLLLLFSICVLLFRRWRWRSVGWVFFLMKGSIIWLFFNAFKFIYAPQFEQRLPEWWDTFQSVLNLVLVVAALVSAILIVRKRGAET